MAKRKIYIISICVIIASALFAALLLFTIDYFVTKDKINSYLADNHAYITSDGDNIYGNIIEDGYKVFLAGETRGTEKNPSAQLAMIKMLYGDYGVDRILLELPHSCCVALNRYLDGGDETILDEVFAAMPDDYFMNSDSYREFFVALKTFNNGLDANGKLKLLGLEKELSDTTVKNAVALLQEMTAGLQTASDRVNENWRQLAELDTTQNYSNQTLAALFGAMNADLSLAKNTVYAALGDNAADYHCLVNTLAESISAASADMSSSQSAQAAENLFYTNFKIFYDAEPAKLYFGQMAAEHVYLATMNSADADSTFAQQIDSWASLSGKVCVIKYSYENSAAADFAGGKEFSIKQSLYEKEFNNYGNSPSAMTLFRLDAEGSIFNTQQVMVSGGGKRTTDYYRYVLLIENSAALEKAA